MELTNCPNCQSILCDDELKDGFCWDCNEPLPVKSSRQTEPVLNDTPVADERYD